MLLTLFILAILSFAGVVTGLILTIVGLATEKSKVRNAGLITLATCLIVLLVSIVYGTKGAIQKFQTWSEHSVVSETSTEEYFTDECNRQALLDTSKFDSPVKKIQLYHSDTSLREINPQFFTDCGNFEFQRFPIRYPFAIHYQTQGVVCSLSEEKNLYENTDETSLKDNLIMGITDLNYDRNYLLLRVDRSLGAQDSTDSSKIIFCIFNFETMEVLEFKTEREMSSKAAKLNYEGDFKLWSIKEYMAEF